MTTADAESLTSLVLSALLADDALTALELRSRLRCTTPQLRRALRELLAAGCVTTSGRTSGTRYVLAIEEAAQPPGAVAALAPQVSPPLRRAPRQASSPCADLMPALLATAAHLGVDPGAWAAAA